jgi:O-antigen ligase
LKPLNEHLIVAAILAVGAGIGAATGLIGLAAFGAIGLGLLGVWFVFTYPALSLRICFFLVLVGQIKFRWRDPGAALSSNVDGQIAFELAMYGVVLFISLVNLLDVMRGPSRMSRNEAMLLLYVALAFLSIAWSVAANITVVRALQLAILYLFCFCAVRRFGPTELLKILGLTLVLSVLLFAAMAVVFPFANGTRMAHELSDFSWEEGTRFTWFAVQPINAGAQTGAAIIFLFCCAGYFPRGWKSRLLGVPLWAYLAPLVLVLAATRARGPLFATLAALVVFALRRYARLRVVSWVGVVGGLLIFLAVLNVNTGALSEPDDIAANPNPVMRFLLRGQSASDFSSMSGRSGLWSAEETLFTSRPFLGFGFAASRGPLLNVLPWAGEAHNALGQTALDLGLLGILILWVPLVTTFFQSLLRRDPYHDDWTSAVIVVFLTFMLVDGFSEAGFTGVVSYLPVIFFATMFAHRDGWGGAVQHQEISQAAFAPDRVRGGRPAWALQRPTGGTV